MALGRPVITADSAALTEFFTPGEHVVTVPPGNPEALVHAIRMLVDSSQERHRIGTAAASRIQEAFLPQHIGAQLKTIIEQVGQDERTAISYL
jgi:glycosyltransferase involved in cell wall biosynthesis